MSFRQFRFFLFILGFGPIASAMAGDSALDWLMKMSSAVRQQNYEGTFIYRHGDQLEAMRIVHRSDNGASRERLVSQNGEAREIIRNNRGVTAQTLPKGAVRGVPSGSTVATMVTGLIPLLGLRNTSNTSGGSSGALRQRSLACDSLASRLLTVLAPFGIPQPRSDSLVNVADQRIANRLEVPQPEAGSRDVLGLEIHRAPLVANRTGPGQRVVE